ncbi:hypothetical protein [Streptomyces sp. Z26]|uniref:hypothetical protein n=1 Tax=Streptomyces sp. Z26 TaxID=2500177 RepID=UPI000EF173A2|nr:hypothetical protein [Streptomyces sp. Z26]RLL66961.1 hypothetical protein D7M15_08870 [Streptomyces sp. Z26]
MSTPTVVAQAVRSRRAREAARVQAPPPKPKKPVRPVAGPEVQLVVRAASREAWRERVAALGLTESRTGGGLVATGVHGGVAVRLVAEGAGPVVSAPGYSRRYRKGARP